MASKPSIALAMRRHQAGRRPEAEQICRRVLLRRPTDPAALHLLGVLRGQAGDPEAAEQLISRAVGFRPNYWEAWRTLGQILLDRKKFARAAGAYQSSCELNPNDAEAWYGLGMALRQNDDDAAAIGAFERAMVIHPDFADALVELGNAYRRQGALEKAIAASSRVVQLRPDSSAGYNNLGNALVQSGNVQEGIQCIQRAIELQPSSPIFYANLGDALRRHGSLADALSAFEHALELEAGFPLAMLGRGAVLTDMARFPEAVQAHRAAVEAMPDSALAHEWLGNTLAAMGDTGAAIIHFRKAVELRPTDADFWNRLGGALQATGTFEEANVCFHQALEVKPGDVMAYRNLATSRSGLSEPEIAKLTVIAVNPQTSPLDRAAAGFALGKACDDLDQFDLAFARYTEANRAIKDLRASEGTFFSSEIVRAMVDGSIKAFSPEFFKARAAWGDPTDMPVFIVGMPRSGTTLVEQIAASHSQVFGAGELVEMGMYARSMGEDPSAWNAERVSQTATAHKHRLNWLGSGTARVIDKTPGNIFHLGLIATLFPNARVIFCRRDPRDNCLSCYFQWFAESNVMFSYDLQDCAAQYLEQERLTEHWLKSLPLKTLSIGYEELVGDVGGQSRRLIDFLSLGWEEKCLDFHKTRRTVSTASRWQVRQPIYHRSVGRWRHYEKHLGALLRQLGI
jgi:tetratricopeptide (TPR) repeat protein